MRRRRALWVLLALGSILVILAVVGQFFLGPLVKDRIIRIVATQLDSELELQSLNVRLFPRPGVSGEQWVIRHHGRRDVPPLITLERFSADATIAGLLSEVPRVRRVSISGLHVFIPPREPRPSDEDDRRPTKPQESEVPGAPMPEPAAETSSPAKPSSQLPVIIEELTSESVRLEIARRKPGRPPRLFQIHSLRLESIQLDGPASYDARLTNPTPRGEIHAVGQFGPFNKEEPALTPVAGTYTFADADLGTIKGIGGILQSEGRFGGYVERIEAEGHTESKDFHVDVGGRPVELYTQFRAIIDGTNGDTYLQPVNAQFLSTSLVAIGGVYRSETPDRQTRGRAVDLDITIDQGRIEDLLHLALRDGPPIMTGAMHFKSSFLLPPGEPDVPDRLNLDGEFSVASAQFTDEKLQQKIDELSRRGQGRPEDEELDRAVSNLRGRFTMSKGVINFSSLRFDVQGAAVMLSGRYALKSEAMDFAGTLNLDASPSRMVTGKKSALLRLFDPLLRRGSSGTVIPFKLTGTRKKPEFDVLVVKALTGRFRNDR